MKFRNPALLTVPPQLRPGLDSPFNVPAGPTCTMLVPTLPDIPQPSFPEFLSRRDLTLSRFVPFMDEDNRLSFRDEELSPGEAIALFEAAIAGCRRADGSPGTGSATTLSEAGLALVSLEDVQAALAAADPASGVDYTNAMAARAWKVLKNGG